MFYVIMMSNKKKLYSLIPEELPKSGARRTSLYDELLDDFMQGKADTAKVEYPGKSNNALMAGLRSRIKTRDLKARIVLRKGRLYITKI